MTEQGESGMSNQPSAKPPCNEYQADGTREGVCTCGSAQIAHSRSIMDIAREALDADVLRLRLATKKKLGRKDDSSWFDDASSAGHDIADRYATLRAVLTAALMQAADGKGSERHDPNSDRFEDQQIVQLGEWMQSTHGVIFQACKKSIESTGLSSARARAELLGAINYLAAAVVILDRQLAKVGE